jgi:uncharacterized protein DUF5004
MKKTCLLLLLSGLIVSMVINSCKKDNTSAIQTLFTGGKWQLASVLVTYKTGNQVDSTVTLNTNCDSIQYFTFNKDNTCTYTNFDCLPQSSGGKWSLASNQLFLYSDMVCKDTTKTGSSKPFSNAQIYNLGQFSLVLKTGDIQPNYSLTAKLKIIQYGFVRIVRQ